MGSLLVDSQFAERTGSERSSIGADWKEVVEKEEEEEVERSQTGSKSSRKGSGKKFVGSGSVRLVERIEVEGAGEVHSTSKNWERRDRNRRVRDLVVARVVAQEGSGSS